MTPDDILNHQLIARRYFFPQRAAAVEPFWIAVDGACLACQFHKVAAASGTLIYFHGNGELVNDYLDDFPEFFAALGWNCLLAEFRGYGASSGEPRLGQLLDDVVAIIAASGEKPERTVLFGRSVGSIFAIEGIARVAAIGGLILESAIADVDERLRLRVTPAELGATEKEFAAAVEARLNQRRKLENYSGRALIMHCEHDELVEVSHARKLRSWLHGETRLRIFARGGHNDISLVNAQEYWGEVADFLQKV